MYKKSGDWKKSVPLVLGYTFSLFSILYVVHYLFILYFGVKTIGSFFELKGKNYSVTYYVDICKEKNCLKWERHKAIIQAKTHCDQQYNDLFCSYYTKYYIDKIYLNNSEKVTPVKPCSVMGYYFFPQKPFGNSANCLMKEYYVVTTQQIGVPSLNYKSEVPYKKLIREEWQIKLTKIKID